MALKPAALSNSMRRSSARSTAAAPSGPLSWWMHAPRSNTGFPLIRRPLRGSTCSVRTPKVVTDLVTVRPRVLCAVYSDGWSTLHSAGSVRYIRCRTRLVSTGRQRHRRLVRLDLVAGGIVDRGGRASPSGWSGPR